MFTNKIIFIAGPTAVGKSDVALEVAERLDGEIVSCDSMQVYQEINVASNKPSAAERNRVQYHLLDVTSVYEDFDVNRYVKLASEAINNILRRRKIPIVCGGTGMYMEGLIDGVFEGPKADWNLRKSFESRNLNDLYLQLVEVDPDAARKIHVNDARRIIRALEVFELTAKPISVWQKERTGLAAQWPIESFVLTCARDELYQRINLRVDQMFKKGLVDEVKCLESARISRTAAQLIGVKEVLAYLNDTVDLPTSLEEIKKNSRHYAKRQLTWYRKSLRNIWIDCNQLNAVDEILKKVGHE